MEFYYRDTAQDVMILSADGGLNHETADQFAAELGELIDKGMTKLVVDGTKLTYISSAGIGALLLLHKRLRDRGGEVMLCNLHSPVTDVLTLLRMDRVFRIHPSVDEAVAAFGPAD